LSALDAPLHVPEPIRQAVVAAYPELARSTFSVAGRGWHSLAVEVDGAWICKFPQGEEAEQALRREVRLLDAVRPLLTMPVPDMTIHPGPPLFSMHRTLHGQDLERPGYARLDEVARNRLAGDLARFFAELHAVPLSRMRDAGAEPVGVWETGDAALQPVWPLLPPDIRERAQRALHAYRDLAPDPLGEVYGFFDAHGWNMAFDHGAGWLNGIFDFADSGFGPLHREFVPVSLVDPDLAARSAGAYEALTGKALDRSRIFLLTATMRLSELAGAIETGERVPETRAMVVDWFAQREIG
jgi:aminoglycoside phosphotransferase (APT) family kinase protein